MTNVWEIPTKNSDAKLTEIITPAWLYTQAPDWTVSNQQHLTETSLDCARAGQSADKNRVIRGLLNGQLSYQNIVRVGDYETRCFLEGEFQIL